MQAFPKPVWQTVTVSSPGLLWTHTAIDCVLADTLPVWCPVLQGASITQNDVAGLVVNGSADVTITNSTFSDNWRRAYEGSSLLIDGNTSVQMASVLFRNNSVNRGSNAGRSYLSLATRMWLVFILLKMVSS